MEKNSAPDPSAAVGSGGLAPDLIPNSGVAGSLDRLSKNADEPPKRPRRPKGSQFKFNYGTANMKAYPIFQSELWELGGLSALASIAFSIAWACFGFVIDTEKDVELAMGADKAITEKWLAYVINAQWSGGIALGLGAIMLLIGGLKIAAVIKRTDFES